MVFTANVVRTTTWVDAQILTAPALNGEFNNLFNALNIVNADIAAGAAIVGSKLASPLTGVTLSNPIINSWYDTPQTYTPAGAGTATLDLSLSNDHRITMPAGNITIAVSNAVNGKKFILSITQDSGGSRTVTWFSTIRWVGGSAPTLTTTGNKRDVFGFICTGTATFDGFVVGLSI